MSDSLEKQGSSSGETSLDLGTKLSFSVAAMASGTLSMGVAYFSMVFYNAALGVPATLVGAALALALVVDAISDPLVGGWSDRLRTRWGRWVVCFVR